MATNFKVKTSFEDTEKLSWVLLGKPLQQIANNYVKATS